MPPASVRGCCCCLGAPRLGCLPGVRFSRRRAPSAWQAGEPVGEQAIQLISISNRNLLDAAEGGARGAEELARLREVYVRRHGRGLPLDQVGAAKEWMQGAAAV